MKLRQITKNDFKWIIHHYIDVFSSEPWNDELTYEEIENYVLALFDMNTFIGYLAEIDGENEPIGVSLGYIKPWFRGKEYHLDTFFITKNQESKGFGSQFMQLIKADLQLRNIPDIMLDTDKGMPAEKFYIKNGFETSEDTILMFSGTK